MADFELTDDDLRVDPAFFGVADAAQLVFLVGLEVERGHVVEHKGEVAVAGSVRVAVDGKQARARGIAADSPVPAAGILHYIY